MREIELEEGEAYFLQDDDDENIDPDRDFSYIDKKIENVLGHYQKDFMGGLSAETLGARFGGYGSFLPMQQRSPPILSNPTTQSHISAKSPQNPSSERFHQNPSAAANHSLVVRPGLSSNDHSMPALSEPGMSLTKKQSELQSSGEVSFKDQHKKPLMHHPEQSSLKFRVKMTSEKLSSRDNSALYSGLGLDMSPSSSPDDSPAEPDRTSPGIQEREEDSPSCIVKIMTSPPLSNDALLSPLDGRLISFMGMENNVESGLPGSTQVLPVNDLRRSTVSEAKRETSNESKSKLNKRSMDKKSKEKESRKDRISKQKVQSMKAEELVKENQGYPADAVTLSTNRKEASKILVAKAVVSKTSVNASDAHSEVMELAALTGNSTGSKPSAIFDKKNEVGHLEQVTNKSLKEDGRAKARDKSKGELVSLPSQDVGMGGEGNVNTLRGKIDKNVMSNLRNEVGRKEGEANKFPKQQGLAKEKAKDVVLNSVFPKEEDVHRNENVIRDRIPKDTDVGFVSMKVLAVNDKNFDLSQERKGHNVETIEPSKKKSHFKASNPQMGAGVLSGKEHSSAIVKKKSKESHTDGVSAAEPPRESLMAGYSAIDNEVMSRSNIPSKSKKVDIDLPKEMRKDIDLVSNAYPGRKGKEVHSKATVMGVSQRETHAFNGRMKEKSSFKKPGIASIVGSNMVGDQAGGTTAMEKAPAAGVLPAENALSMVMDDWVQCENCEKWRLLPFGKNPDLLPKEWLCEMLDWLPGMNKCSVSEDETTSALYAMYQLQVPASLLQNNQQADPVGSAPLGASAASLPTRATDTDAMPMPGGGNKRNLVRMETNAARQSGFQGLDIPVKNDQHFGENRMPKNPKKFPRELDAISKNGDVKSSNSAKKRVADFEASRVPKKMKRQSMENPDLVGMLTVKAKREGPTYNPGALPISEDFAEGIPESPLMKGKDRTQNAMVARINEKKDISGKKRNLKDQCISVIPTEELSVKAAAGKISDTEHRKDKKEKRSKVSNFQGRESSANKGSGKTQSDVGKHNLGFGGDNSLPNGSRMNDMHPEKHHAGRASQRTVESRKSSERAHDLGLENATTSSSSKISCKVRAKKWDVKCSPVGSISSSPMRLPKADPDKSVNKTSVLYAEPEELLFSAKRLKSRAEGPSNEFASHNEEMRVRKSNLSKTSGNMFDTSDDDHSAKKLSSGRRPTAHRIDTHPKLENHECGNLDIANEEGTSTALQDFVSENQSARSLNRLHFDETNSIRGKSHVSGTTMKKEPASHILPKLEEGSGTNVTRVDKVTLRHPHAPRNVARDIGASSSIAESFYKAAKTALKEATDLKHSANHLKKSGSGLESTVVFFQAALKFLEGASLLEPENSESGRRCGEMSPSDVYSSTAGLCEYCAREYERCNDMASAALAYKCMEVAYMRVVYYNDLSASRDRVQLQMAVRDAPRAESPSSSASDVDNLNNQIAMDTAKNGDSATEHQNHVISAGNRPNFVRMLDFTKDINLAMEASRRSQSAFAAANPVLTQARNEEGISCIKRVLDFSFHDVDGLLCLVRLALKTLNN